MKRSLASFECLMVVGELEETALDDVDEQKLLLAPLHVPELNLPRTHDVPASDSLGGSESTKISVTPVGFVARFHGGSSVSSMCSCNTPVFYPGNRRDMSLCMSKFSGELSFDSIEKVADS